MAAIPMSGLLKWREKHTNRSILSHKVVNSGQTRPLLRLRSAHMNKDSKTIDELEDQILKHIVRIYVRQNDPQSALKSQSVGTGLIVDKRGYIITNCHVVGESTMVKVHELIKSRFASSINIGLSFETELVYAEPDLDLALIRTKQQREDWPSADPLLDGCRSARDVMAGEEVLTFGNPNDIFCLSDGIVNDIDRQAATHTGPSKIIYTGLFNDQNKPFMSHTCRTAPGFSGGPVVDMSGKVLAIHFAGFDECTKTGIHFADAKEFLNRGMNYRLNETKNTISFSRQRSLGISVHSFNLVMKLFVQEMPGKDDFADDISSNKGLIVLDSLHHMLSIDGNTGDMTEENYIKKFDIILSVNENEVNSVNELQMFVNECNELKVNVYRDNSYKDLTINTKPSDLLLF